MSDEKEKKDASQPQGEERKETFFLPPLKMVLAFFDKESRQREKRKKDAEEQEKVEKNVEKLIEKLEEEDE
ncbi:MAG TPA: hypothetical protein VK897_00075 [Anaerolineales bacterium]|nr:hypothetical protein [Anaerolineales bacterium]